VPVAAHKQWEARLESHGASIESRTQYTSYARDPEGNRVAISHHGE
jgi:glyoxylase I family protein